jgi:lysophospholipid acyltransferase (LPLAT)-like uncharacterized protein
MASWRRIARSRGVQKSIGIAAAEYLRFVWKTTRFQVEPPDIYERVVPDLPVILGMWHGQHFLMPFIKLQQHRAKVLISRHRDGEMNAVAAERLGIGTIRGSGAHNGEFYKKGGISAFHGMLEALREGYTVALTADVPKVARAAGMGIVKLAQASGRPIYPIAMATQRRYELNNWDRSALNLPFGRGATVVHEPIRVPADADEDELESRRRQVEASLNAATARAYALVDRRDGAARG